MPEAAPAQAGDTNRPGERDIDRARRLFQRGIEYEQKQSWDKALEMMQQVALVKLTPQVQYHMALCEENLGNLDTALNGYKSALSRADAVGASFKRELEQKVRALEARIRGGAP